MSHTTKGEFDAGAAQWRVSIAGEIDIASAHTLREELEAMYSRNVGDMVVDASELTYLDSTGLGVIIGLYSKLKDDGKKIRLENPRDNVKKLLKVTQFDKILC